MPSKSPSPRKSASKSKRRSAPDDDGLSLVFIALLAAALVLCLALYSQAPPLDKQLCADDLSPAWLVRAVWSGDKGKAVRELKECVRKYDGDHPAWAVVLYVVLYVVMQTFAIPGPIILSLLTGALWPYGKSLLLISLCATGGASCCYLLSRSLRIGGWFKRADPARYELFRDRVAKEDAKGNLLYYMLFLRLTPLMPNWFINLMSPYAGIPLQTFALATAIGLIPANTLHYYSGQAIANAMEDENSTARNFAIFLALQGVALLPVFFKGRIEKMDEQMKAQSKKTNGRAKRKAS